jgi:hypothetical protein
LTGTVVPRTSTDSRPLGRRCKGDRIGSVPFGCPNRCPHRTTTMIRFDPGLEKRPPSAVTIGTPKNGRRGRLVCLPGRSLFPRGSGTRDEHNKPSSRPRQMLA